MKIYVNGILRGTGTANLGTLTNRTDSLRIGTRGSNPFNGQIDEVQIFNYALTAEQVKTLYNDGAVRFGD